MNNDYNNRSLLNQALYYYDHYSDQTFVPQQPFIDSFNRDSSIAKSDLQTLLAKHSAYIPELDLIAIPFTMEQIDRSATQREALNHLFDFGDTFHVIEIKAAIDLILCEPQQLKNRYPTLNVAHGRKLSRIVRDLYYIIQEKYDLNIPSDFNQRYAKAADALKPHTTQQTLFVSANPAYILTASNPENDSRGDTMTSCHSLNNYDSEYATGNISLALDYTTLIAFTTSSNDPIQSYNDGTLFNRKTSRQFYFYQAQNYDTPQLVRSRLYSTTREFDSTRSDTYRDIVQSILSECNQREYAWINRPLTTAYPNLVRTQPDYRGYTDWSYTEYDCSYSFSIYQDQAPTIYVGAAPICTECGCEWSSEDPDYEGTLCESCNPESNHYYCEFHDHYVTPDRAHLMETAYHNGLAMQVCNSCLEQYFTYCEHCHKWIYNSEVTIIDIPNNVAICDTCLDHYYIQCDECGSYFEQDEMEYLDCPDGSTAEVCHECAAQLRAVE